MTKDKIKKLILEDACSIEFMYKDTVCELEFLTENDKNIFKLSFDNEEKEFNDLDNAINYKINNDLTIIDCINKDSYYSAY